MHVRVMEIMNILHVCIRQGHDDKVRARIALGFDQIRKQRNGLDGGIENTVQQRNDKEKSNVQRKKERKKKRRKNMMKPSNR
jgi:hypothetical protein